jgi:hypothetical protein
LKLVGLEDGDFSGDRVVLVESECKGDHMFLIMRGSNRVNASRRDMLLILLSEHFLATS